MLAPKWPQYLTQFLTYMQPTDGTVVGSRLSKGVFKMPISTTDLRNLANEPKHCAALPVNSRVKSSEISLTLQTGRSLFQRLLRPQGFVVSSVMDARRISR